MGARVHYAPALLLQRRDMVQASPMHFFLPFLFSFLLPLSIYSFFLFFFLLLSSFFFLIFVLFCFLSSSLLSCLLALLLPGPRSLQ